MNSVELMSKLHFPAGFGDLHLPSTAVGRTPVSLVNLDWKTCPDPSARDICEMVGLSIASPCRPAWASRFPRHVSFHPMPQSLS